MPLLPPSVFADEPDASPISPCVPEAAAPVPPEALTLSTAAAATATGDQQQYGTKSRLQPLWSDHAPDTGDLETITVDPTQRTYSRVSSDDGRYVPGQSPGQEPNTGSRDSSPLPLSSSSMTGDSAAAGAAVMVFNRPSATGSTLLGCRQASESPMSVASSEMFSAIEYHHTGSLQQEQPQRDEAAAAAEQKALKVQQLVAMSGRRGVLPFRSSFSAARLPQTPQPPESGLSQPVSECPPNDPVGSAHCDTTAAAAQAPYPSPSED